MHPRYYISTHLMPFLSDKDKLAVRSVSKSWQEVAQTAQMPPYRTKAEFLVGVGRLFYQKDYFQSAWAGYSTTITSTSSLPAMLYKLTEKDELCVSGAIDEFAQGESLKDTGRRYGPSHHAWDVNLVWMLAQIHAGRSFVILSELKPEYVMRKDFPTVFSAFAREVGVAFKAGYTIGHIDDNFRVHLDPPHNKNLNVKMLDPSPTEITKSVKNVNNAKRNYEKSTSVARKIQEIFCQIENKDLEELKSLAATCKESIANLLESIFDNCDEKDKLIALNTFVKTFNDARPFYAPELLNRRTQTSFFKSADEYEIGRIESNIISALKMRINHLIKNAIPKQLNMSLSN